MTATPAAAIMPMKNGERRSSGRPGRPSPPVSSATLAATSTASWTLSSGAGLASTASPARAAGPASGVSLGPGTGGS
ncbi:MAG: hypothetical protein ACRDPO_03550 [Streptosporangiaceae bacterium]